MAMMASASTGNPYEHYDNTQIEQDLIDPDDANINDLDDPSQSNSDRAPLTGNIQSSSSRNPLPQGYLNSSIPGEDRRAPSNTIDESVWETLSRDLLAVWEKMRQVLWPKYLLGGILQRGGGIGGAERGEGDGLGGGLRGIAGRWPDADVVLQGGMSEGLRDWDLWGPLIFCLLLSLLLSMTASGKQKTIVFSGVFALVWIGEAVVTMQIKLLGGNISFFQSICIIGYTLFPLVIAAMLSALHLPTIARVPVYIVLIAWSLAAGVSILGGSGVVKNRVGIAEDSQCSLKCFNMIQTPPVPEDAQDFRPTAQRNVSNGASKTFDPSTDSASDNDASERAAREKLKKTSIASISQHAMVGHDSTTVAQDPRPKADDNLVTMPGSIPKDHAPANEQPKPDVDASRGRPVRKRSFDDLEAADAEANKREALERKEEKANGHARKRSRDVRVGEPVKEDGRSRGITVAVEEEAEDVTTEKDSHEPMDKDMHELQEAGDVAEHNEVHDPMDKDSQEQEEAEDEVADKGSHHTLDNHVQKLKGSTYGGINTLEGAEMEENEHRKEIGEPAQRTSEAATNSVSEAAEKETSDHEMRDSTVSPRKKRSRDQFDPDVDREQKIAATEETRAHRRSDEMSRSETSVVGAHDALQSQVHDSETQKAPDEAGIGFRASTAEAEIKKVPSIFGSASILAPPAAHIKNDSPAKPSNLTKSDQQSQTSASAFASSGFAALSRSTTSPFGATGAASAAASTPSPFATTSPFSPKKDDPDASRKTEPVANGGFSAFAKSQTPGFGTSEPSPFGITGAAKTSVFGGSIFGGGFGGAFGGGSKLANFAAPTGDTKLGNGAIKPIGSPAREGDDEENSESDTEGFGENGRGDLNDEGDERFQHQDVETGEDGEETIFSGRASLYAFKDKVWKESGKGNFKLNVIATPPDEDGDEVYRTGRFIMRAHQTYRVLLNAPVFKGMVIGEGKGNEPTGKSFAFGVIEEGKLIPHMVKLGDVTESKTLFHEVRKLQEGLTEP